MEYTILKVRIELLQKSQRYHMGENLDVLSMKELQNLEQQIDTALKRFDQGETSSHMSQSLSFREGAAALHWRQHFLSSNGISLSNARFINRPQVNILTFGSSGFDIDNILINSAGDSPNTGVIHIQSAHNISITNSILAAGDDCVSIGDYRSNIWTSDVKCGSGHGISIGSLGRDGNEVLVENIHVRSVSFTNSTNGAKIKTWQVGWGYVRDFPYEIANFDSVECPIIIDQNYCSPRDDCKETKTGVHISNVTFSNFSGTRRTDVAVSLNCSRTVDCSGFTLQSIKLTYAETENEVTSSCTNARGNALGLIEPSACLI